MRRDGFTAPEVTMVALLVMLATAAVMAVNGLTADRARDITCMTNLQQLAIALQLYAADNDCRLPACPRAWDAVFPYYKNKSVELCPFGPTARKRATPFCPT